MGMVKLLLPAIIACVCNAAANTLWKLQLSKHPLDISSLQGIFSSVINIKIIIGIILYGLSMIIFFFLLSNYRMADVVPLVAMTYVFSLLAAYIVFKEQLAFIQVIGVTIILFGIFIYAKGAAQ